MYIYIYIHIYTVYGGVSFVGVFQNRPKVNLRTNVEVSNAFPI